MRLIIKLLFTLIGLGTALLLALGVWVFMDYQKFVKTPLVHNDGGWNYTLKPGSSMRRLADDMVAAGLVDHPYYLLALAKVEGLAHRIKAGEYHVEPNLLPVELLRTFVDGKVKQYSLTLVEGLNFREMMQVVSANPILISTLDGLSGQEVMERLGYPAEHPEGRFLPDTYLFPKGTSDLGFLKRAHDAMDYQLHRLWQQRAKNLPYKSPYEALIMASIVEKETGKAKERSQIAGVFVRRLQRGMRLQTDPTVIYGIGPSFDGNIRRADLRRDTPYNTYTRHGLPPTPIAMPGIDAIKAALHPVDGKSLYFVSKGDGSHYFSATLAEHNRAVRKYQLRR